MLGRFSFLNKRFAFLGGQAGFSLVEIIAVLVLLGIMGAGAGLGISNIVTGFMVTRDTSAIAGKAQLALLRLSRELRVITSVSAASATSITFTALHGSGVSMTYTVSKSGDTITLNDGVNNDVLVDKVNALTFAYYDTFAGAPATTWATSRRMIQITMAMNGPNSNILSFVTRVTPRNL